MGNKLGLKLKENPSGMVSREIFKNKIKELTMIFPTWKVDVSKREVMELLYKHLGYVNDKDFEEGIDEYICKEKFNPTVAGLKDYVKSNDSRVERLCIGAMEYRNGVLTRCTEHRFGSVFDDIIIRVFEDGYSELVIDIGTINIENCELTEDIKNKYFTEIEQKLIKG